MTMVTTMVPRPAEGHDPARPDAAPAAGPGWLTGARQGTIDREPLWYSWAAALPPEWPWRDEVTREADLEPVPTGTLAGRLRSAGERLRFRDVAALDRGGAAFGLLPPPREATDTALAALLVDVMRGVRRDPADPYNDHRGYASARCQFPVVAAVSLRGTWWVVDPATRTLLDTRRRAAGPGIALTGSPVGMPRVYRWFRGTLVTLEIGIVARHLAVLAAHHGLALRLVDAPVGQPADGIENVWAEPGQWSRPLLFVPEALPEHEPAGAGAHRTRPVQLQGRAPLGSDPSLASACDLLHRTPWGPGTGVLGSGIPAGLPPTALSLDDVVFARSAGRMPAGRHGFRLADQEIDADAAEDLVSWMSVAAPRAVRAGVRLRFFRNGVRGLAPDVLQLDLLEDGRTGRHTLPPRSSAALAGAYGYPTSAAAGSDLARSPLVCLVTGRPGEAVAHHGPAVWTRLAATAGWAVHGGCLAMAGHGLVARPARAFDDRLLQQAAGLDDDEMPLLALIVGRPQPHGVPQIALPL